MILVGLGANLPSRFGAPKQTLSAAKKALEEAGIKILSSSRIWLTAPVPFDPAQDWFHNAVLNIETNVSAYDLLKTLNKIEDDFGRIRSVPNAPRLLDLDIIAYNENIISEGDSLTIPHERMHERLFVLKPLQDISKNWTHPKLGIDISKMLEDISDDQQAKPLEGAW